MYEYSNNVCPKRAVTRNINGNIVDSTCLDKTGGKVSLE